MFAELGIKTALRLTDFYDESLRAGLESISKMARRRKANSIERWGDPIISAKYV